MLVLFVWKVFVVIIVRVFDVILMIILFGGDVFVVGVFGLFGMLVLGVGWVGVVF